MIFPPRRFIRRAILPSGLDRFEIDPKDHIAAGKRARERGQRIIGCYHSHPNGVAEPSAQDLSRAGEKDFLWLIAATDGAACTPWPLLPTGTPVLRRSRSALPRAPIW